MKHLFVVFAVLTDLFVGENEGRKNCQGKQAKADIEHDHNRWNFMF
jgi:hypothetical protein